MVIDINDRSHLECSTTKARTTKISMGADVDHMGGREGVKP